MPVFVSSKSSVNRHGVFALSRRPGLVIKAKGFGNAGLVGTFPWGPYDQIIEPGSIKERGDIIAPPGMSRTGTGYLATIAKNFPLLKLARAVGTTTVKATATLPNAVPTNILTLTLKYVGAAGNSVIATVSDPSDGDTTNHFNLKVSVTGASGTTEDTIENLNYSGTGADSNPDLSGLLLLGSIAKLVAGRPVNGSVTFATGSDGTINSASYVGTAGAGDKGLAMFESDSSIRRVCADDCGTSLRAAVNAGFVAHTTLQGDRVAFINGDSGLSAASTRTDAGSYRSERVVYMDPWVYEFDDVDGTKRLVTPAPFAMSVHAQLSPSTSIAWKNPEVIAMLQGIAGLEQQRGAAAGGNTDAGVATFIREEDGGYTIEAGVVTIAPNDPAREDLTRTSIGDYIAIAFVKSTRSMVDGPNVEVNQTILLGALDTLMSDLKKAAKNDPDHDPHVVNYRISDVDSENTASDISSGDFNVGLDVETSTGMKRIFLNIRYGPGVIIAQAA